MSALAACSPGEKPVPPSPSASADAAATPAPGASSSVPPGTSPEEYRSTLTTALGPVGSSLDAVAGSRSLKSLGKRLEQAESAVGDAAERLGGLTPPPEIGAEHSDYVAALRGLGNDLGDARESVDGRRLCTASAVLAELGKADGLGAVKSAGGHLAAKGDYPADVVKLKAPKALDRRLANGAFIRSGSRSGRGQLTVDNGGGQDAVLTLVRGTKKVTSFYVRKGRKATVNGVPDGTYKIFFTGGADWDDRARAFTRDCSFKRFEDSLRFRTIRTATLIRWSTWKLTLQPVVGGNARTSEVDPDDFPG